MATEQLPTLSRRDRQREETRRDLAHAAIDLASARGLANVRVPDIAAAAGVSTRTFNNYFPSKEAAIAWPVTRRAARLADNLLSRPVEEPLAAAIRAAVTELHEAHSATWLPGKWLRKFQSVVAAEPALMGEYLKAASQGEQLLGDAIAVRMGVDGDELRPQVLAAVVAGAERAATRHWMRHPDQSGTLIETVQTALRAVLQEVEDD